ncbi:trichohyalin-like [Rhopalosiphum maidis]|uniref:trichohyalin-like n=1 Tax=Rhopalosiphum maidis TaxID=43146 RepID=UPI000F000B51|nr:trichohyalin-like [Rhopalosiphum maidis]XP_026818109.1 trichohyalin-like [Rhopalosiphum maidis]
MCPINGNIDVATETTDSLVFKPLAGVIYICVCSYLLWAATTAGQRLNATGYGREKRADVKTSQSKSKKSTSTTVRMKDNKIKNTSTAQLQICNGSGPKSDTIIYNIKRSSNQKMENRRQEEDFIIVVSKRERRRLQQLKMQKQEKQQEQKKQEEQLQQQKQDKQQQKLQKLEKQQKKQQNKQQQKPQGLERQQEQKKQEERKKIEKPQQKPKNQQQLKKKQPQEKQQKHDNPLQQEIITPTNNNITATLTKLPKTSVLLNEQPTFQSFQLNDKKSEVNITKELLCIKNESSIKSFLADCDKELNAERDVQLDEMQNLENLTTSEDAQGFNDHVEASRIKNHCSTTDFDKNNKKLELLEIENATKDNEYLDNDIHENENRCKEHDTIIKDLREENENMRAQYELLMKNNWSDSEFKIVLEGVRAEIEMNRLDEIKKLVDDHQVMLEELKTEHDAEVNGLHIYYQSILNNIQMNHDIVVGAIHMKHEKIIKNLRTINYDQSQRYETAMQSMRQVKKKMSKEHQTEVRALREKYESTVKDHEIAMSYLIKEKELLRAEHEKVVQEMSEKNEDQHHTTIKTITNGHDDKDVDTRTTTIADDGAVDVFKTENSTLNHTVID